jgi:hypothetical protein
MLTLDPVLIAAQSSQSRHPILEILSSSGAAAIPFDGFLLSTSAINEQHPGAIAHSSGRLCIAFAVGPDGSSNYHVRYGYTDTDRTYWTYVDIDAHAPEVLGEITLCERADASVGIIYVSTAAGTTSVKYIALTITGTALLPAVAGTIFTQVSTAFLTGPFVITLADDSYLMVYGLQAATHYHLYKRTSADFVTWSAASELSLAGLTDTNKKCNPSLIQLATGDIWLWFDYVEATGPNGEELTNIYLSVSTDNGATWSAPAAKTTYTTYGEVAAHPVAAQKTALTMHLVYDKIMGALKMDDTTSGWLTGDVVSNISFDTANGKIYVTSVYNQAGGKVLQNVVKIDLATWTIDKCWDETTAPAFDAALCDGSLHAYPYMQKGDGDLIPVGTCAIGANFVQLLHGSADTITTYAFEIYAPSSIPKNVDYTPPVLTYMKTVQVDAAANRLYVSFAEVQTLFTHITIGYIDLTAPGPSYTFTKILDDWPLGVGAAYGNGFNGFDYEFVVLPSDDLIIVTCGDVSYLGVTAIFTLSTGALYKRYTTADCSTYPRHGLRRVAYKSGILYGAFPYEAGYGEQDKRGICIIDTATDIITFDRPPSAHDEYGLYAMCWGATNKLLIASYLYGIYAWDPSSRAWTLYDNTTVPGMSGDGNNEAAVIAYDATDDFILAGFSSVSIPGYWTGISVFASSGYMKQATYILGTDAAGWTWAAAAALVSGYSDSEAAPVVDAAATLYAFWANKLLTEYSLKWDKDDASFDLTPYLVRPSDITWKESIVAGSPNELSFEVANGHLFDTTNVASLWRTVLEKGRTLTLRAGDTVSGTDYWTAQGTFYVVETDMSGYERGHYPIMRVRAADERVMWDQMQIIASPYYDGNYPEYIIEDLLTRYAGKLAAQISLGTWSSRHLCYMQFLDTSVKDAIEQLCKHFGYAIHVATDGTITAKKISTAAAVDLTYTDQSKLYRLPIKDAYSSFINQVIVKGEERDYIEVLYSEERVAALNASHRWNTGDKSYTVWYSEDRSRTVRNPRLVVLDSVTSLAFRLAGHCGESLSGPSPYNPDQNLRDKYCVITVESPDLSLLFGICIAALLVECLIFDWTAPAVVVPGIPVTVAHPSGIGATVGPGIVLPTVTIPWGRVLQTLTLVVALQILGSTGNFAYEVWGQPVGLVRRQCQSKSDAADANDAALQLKLGRTITTTITDPLCYSVAECDRVAAYEMMVIKAQRTPLRAEKVVDLRLEAGDTISHPHPWSNDAIDIYVTDLTRTYHLTDGAGAQEESLKDTIEGWVTP